MCIKVSSNLHSPVVHESKPKRCIPPLACNVLSSTSSEEKCQSTTTKRSYSSKFDRAMSVYTSHFNEKGFKKILKEATSQEETAPSPSAVQTLHTQGITPPLITALQRIPLEYKPSYLETTASVHSEMGNSIHSSSSVARRSVDLYGLRVFKALVILHEMMGGSWSEIEEDGKEEVVWWFEVLGHDLSLDGGERGYGNLLKLYITYLKALLVSTSPTRGSKDAKSKLDDLRTAFSVHQNLSLANHAFREVLLASIDSSQRSSIGAKVAALRLVLKDAVQHPKVHEELLGMMRREGICEGVVSERERIFEMRREEVFGFLGRCRVLGLDLDLDLNLGLEEDIKVEEKRDLKQVEDLEREMAGFRI